MNREASRRWRCTKWKRTGNEWGPGPQHVAAWGFLLFAGAAARLGGGVLGRSVAVALLGVGFGWGLAVGFGVWHSIEPFVHGFGEGGDDVEAIGSGEAARQAAEAGGECAGLVVLA